MFNITVNNFVDQVQGMKKQFVGKIVTDKEIKETLNSFVDAQTEYTKKAVDAGYRLTTDLGYILYSQIVDFTKKK